MARDYKMKGVVVFDADNTLWDTHEVFQNARRALLGCFSGTSAVSDEESGLKLLRALDRELALRTSAFEYDARRLAAAARFCLDEGCEISDAVDRSLRISNSMHHSVERAYRVYTDALARPARLYSDTHESLAHLRDAHEQLSIVLFSEGEMGRIQGTLQCHDDQCRRFFDEVVIRTKSVESWSAVKEAGLRHLRMLDEDAPVCLLVGDSLTRDVAFGKQAGFVTVYKHSSFFGKEVPKTKEECPDYTISTLGEVSAILRRIAAGVG